MRSIDSFEYSYESPVDGNNTITQIAIDENYRAQNLLTDGSDECLFESLLFASFFRAPGEVVGSGIASMQFGSTNPKRQLLRHLTEEDDRRRRRSLQQGSSGGTEDDERQVARTAEFELQFGIPAGDYRVSSSGSRGRVRTINLLLVCSLLPFDWHS